MIFLPTKIFDVILVEVQKFGDHRGSFTETYHAKKFTEAIETLAHEKEGMSYVDAIVHFCEQNNIDVESVPKLITKPLKEKLKGEAMELNLLKRTSRAKLPL